MTERPLAPVEWFRAAGAYYAVTDPADGNCAIGEPSPGKAT